MLVGACAALLGMTQPASAYPLQFLVVVVSDSQLEPGQVFDVTVSGCDEGDTVDFRLEASTGSDVCAPGEPGSPTGANVASARLAAPLVPGPYEGSVDVATSSGDVGATFSVRVIGEEIIPASIIDPPISGTYDYTTQLTFLLFGLLFLLSCAIAYWYLFRRQRATA